MKIAFIPVRGGSKSIPLKNIKNFCNKPLIFWVCQALQNSKEIDKIVIATDSDQIKKTVSLFRFSKIELYDRDKENAQDNSTTESVMLEYINKQNNLQDNDIFSIIQATNPFLQFSDVNKAFSLYRQHNYDSMLSVIDKHFFTWNDNGKSTNYNYKKRKRRQDFKEKTYLENGSFYINTIKNIKKYKNRLSGNIGLYKMSYCSIIDIDNIEDWYLAEYLFEYYKLNKIIDIQEKKKIKYFFTDCDGVLTDGGYYYTEKGQELKKFNTRDGMGFALLKQKRIKTGIITGDIHKLIRKRFRDLNLDFLFMGTHKKLDDLTNKLHLKDLKEVAYIGDDINDISLLNKVGLAACPSDAHPLVKNVPNIIILNKKGGEGCVREFIDNHVLIS